MVEQLVKAGANVNSVNDNGYSILEATISECMNLPHISISIVTLFLLICFESDLVLAVDRILVWRILVAIKNELWPRF